MQTIRRIELKTNDQEAYEAIKELADQGGNKNRAAITLGCTRRTIDRHIAGYKAEGKAYFEPVDSTSPILSYPLGYADTLLINTFWLVLPCSRVVLGNCELFGPSRGV